MKVVNTKQWINDFLVATENRGIFTSLSAIQEKYIAEPLSKYFPNVSPFEILNYLHANGLFQARNIHEVKKTVDFIEQNKLEAYILNELKKLQKQWNGPNIAVFIFPIDTQNDDLINELKGKSGVGFSDKVFIFIGEEVTKQGVKAIVTHEYHHVCRMKACNKEPNTFTLLDSILIEGLAEYAVYEYVGKNHVAPWANRYSEEELATYWLKYIKANLKMVGKNYHNDILYGKQHRIPKWLGYSIGYDLVTSIVKKHPQLNTKILLNKKSEDLLSLSTYLKK